MVALEEGTRRQSGKTPHAGDAWLLCSRGLAVYELAGQGLDTAGSLAVKDADQFASGKGPEFLKLHVDARELRAHHQDEAFGEDFELPSDRAYSETCAGIGSIMAAWRLLLADGQAQEADHIERVLFNVLATVLPDSGDARIRDSSGATPRKISIPLRPYNSWGNRGPATMRVWLPVL